MATYADIISVTAPSEAPVGGNVAVSVVVKNLYSATIGIMVGGALEDGETPWPKINFPVNSANVAGGATHYFAGRFTMPNYPPGKVIKIHAYSYYYSTDGWHFDDEEITSVKIEAIEEAKFANLVCSYSKR